MRAGDGVMPDAPSQQCEDVAALFVVFGGRPPWRGALKPTLALPLVNDDVVQLRNDFDHRTNSINNSNNSANIPHA